MTIHKEMWADFNDYELAKLCHTYGIEEELNWADNLTLANREQVEKLLTDFELDIAAAGEYL
jgi:uncharacterized protein YlaN (UPF0358 family)